MAAGVAAAVLLLVSGKAQAASLVPSVTDGGSAAPDFRLFPFWEKMLADMAPPAVNSAALLPASVAEPSQAPALANAALIAADTAAPCTDQRHCMPQEWTGFIDSLKGMAAPDQLEAVNRWANARPYVEDMANWFIPDYWATPGEFLARGGDCEDFAAAKYFSLIRLGFAPQDMRIMVVSDTRENSFHAVLTVKLNGTSWVLDNFIPQVTAIENVPFYLPVYSLNEQGWWMHSTPTIQLAGATIIASPIRLERR